MSTALSRPAINNREVRFEPDDERHVRILDGYVAATGESRKSVMCGLLKEWAEKKEYEATLVLRFAGVTPDVSESNRK